MRVFVIPLARDHYELYCEKDHGPVVGDEATPRGFLGRLVQKFHLVLDRVERDSRRPPTPAGPGRLRKLAARARRWLTRWLAARVAEQRVLWQLRGAAAATAVHPADLDEASASEVVRRKLRRDSQRHARRLVVYGLALVASGIVMPIPGPNMLAYYLAFLVVGHFLSLRGARKALDGVAWSFESSVALADLRDAWRLAQAERRDHVQRVGTRLGLDHLATFFERVAVPAP